LFTSPNPRFFIIEVTQSGPINYLLTQSSPGSATPNLDVDYAAWGPFTNSDVMCNGIPLPSPPLTGLTTGCSYSAAATETFNIPNAQAGQFYVILITNFSNQPGVITLTQTNAGQPGAGSTACCPEPGFSYPQSAYCTTGTNPTPVIAAGSLAGVFSAMPSGLVFVDENTGEVNLAASAPGTYVVTNTLAETASCDVRTFSYTITISAPIQASISYPQAVYCSTAAPVNVIFEGTPGGTYASNPPGLYINTATGMITPGQSAAGIYTVTYNILSAGACQADTPSTTVEIVGSGSLQPIDDVVNCGPYVLPALTSGNYYSGSGGTGNAYSAGDEITESMTMYVYAGTGDCAAEVSFEITINGAPELDPVSDVTTCSGYTLPTLTVGAYYTGAGGTGTQLNAGDVINTNQTIYVFAGEGECSSEASFTVTMGEVSAAVMDDVTVCDSYTLPALPAGNNYYTGAGGTGTQLNAGATITSTQTIYIYIADGTCTDESNFVVTVNQTPVLAAVSDVTACGSYTLGSLSVGNYYSGPDGSGDLLDNQTLTDSQTVYVYAQTGTEPNCFAQASFTVTIDQTPMVDDLDDVSVCGSYTLPGLESGGYYTGPGGTGTQLNAGDEITSTQTLYVYAANGSCSAESSFTVSVSAVPAYTLEGGCDGSSYVIRVVFQDATVDPSLYDYEWSVSGGGTIAAPATGPSVVVSGQGAYFVNVSRGDCQGGAVSLEVANTACMIQKGISANNDGQNDYFDLDGQNVRNLQIFNRYGVKVYERANYTNQWYGQTSGGEELPDGTYYYVIDYAAGQTKTGWIYINRKN
jgi:gliding motility-associated-like protein